MEKIEYLYRPDDYAVFILQEDGKYMHGDNVDKGWSGPSWTYDVLIQKGFRPIKDIDELHEVRRLHLEFREYMDWHCRPDGHGGKKGGTYEEFLEERRLSSERTK
jgi:hypothetical protein